MSLHSHQWPTSPNNPMKDAVRVCAFNTAWRKFTATHCLADDEKRRVYQETLRNIVRDLVDHGNSDALMVTHKAYDRLIRIARH